MTALEGVTLVTGGRGFLGRHLVEELERHGAETIRAVGRSDGDLTEQADVRRLLGEIQPRRVIHLAAEVGGIGANLRNPGRYFYANSVMGALLIEESRQAGVEKFVQVGTVCSYPKYTEVPFDEDSIWDGYPEETNAPYGIAKRALLAMLQAYRTQYGFNGIYLLPANLYGPGDNFDPETSHVIPALIRRFAEAAQSDAPDVQLWGTGTPSREFLHVRDAARAIALATLRYDLGAPINIGTGVETSIRDLAETISRLSGYGGEIRWDPSRPDGQPRRSLSTGKANHHFGFQAEVKLEAGLSETIDWWQSIAR